MATETTGSFGATCTPNINAQERQRRLLFGVVALALGFLALLLLILAGDSRWWRLPLILLFYPAAVGFFQWSDHTCVALAAREERKTGVRAEHIDDPEELARIKRQATAVQWKALTTAAALLAVALII